MTGRTPARGMRSAILLVAASIAGPCLAQVVEGRTLSAFLAPVGDDAVLMQDAPGQVGEGAFWRWAGASGLGPRELARAGLTGPELLELVCQFADDIDLARAANVDARLETGFDLIDLADKERDSLRQRLEALNIVEPPELPEDVSARPECVLAPEPDDVAALLADAPGAAPYLIERRLRQFVRRTSTIRILALPDAQQQGGDAP